MEKGVLCRAIGKVPKARRVPVSLPPTALGRPRRRFACEVLCGSRDAPKRWQAPEGQWERDKKGLSSAERKIWRLSFT